MFDTVIELQRGEVDTWTAIRNTGVAVDAILNKMAYHVERLSHGSDATNASIRQVAV